jgi:hypothetical protein
MKLGTPGFTAENSLIIRTEICNTTKHLIRFSSNETAVPQQLVEKAAPYYHFGAFCYYFGGCECKCLDHQQKLCIRTIYNFCTQESSSFLCLPPEDFHCPPQ